MAKVTAPQSAESPKSPGAGGNKMHMPPAPVRAPMGEKTIGTPTSGAAPSMGGDVMSIAPPHRAESAHSSLLPVKAEHSGGGGE